jgi:hypothetical protein
LLTTINGHEWLTGAGLYYAPSTGCTARPILQRAKV